MAMTISQLREAIKDLPGTMKIEIDLASCNIDGRGEAIAAVTTNSPPESQKLVLVTNHPSDRS